MLMLSKERGESVMVRQARIILRLRVLTAYRPLNGLTHLSLVDDHKSVELFFVLFKSVCEIFNSSFTKGRLICLWVLLMMMNYF